MKKDTIGGRNNLHIANRCITSTVATTTMQQVNNSDKLKDEVKKNETISERDKSRIMDYIEIGHIAKAEEMFKAKSSRKKICWRGKDDK